MKERVASVCVRVCERGRAGRCGFSSVGSVHHALRRPSWNTAHRGRESVDRRFIIFIPSSSVGGREGAGRLGSAWCMKVIVSQRSQTRVKRVCHHARKRRRCWVRGDSAALGCGAGQRPAGASGSSQLRVSNYPTWSLVIARARETHTDGTAAPACRGGWKGRIASASTKVVTSRVGREYYSAVVESHHVHWWRAAARAGEGGGASAIDLSIRRHLSAHAAHVCVCFRVLSSRRRRSAALMRVMAVMCSCDRRTGASRDATGIKARPKGRCVAS